MHEKDTDSLTDEFGDTDIDCILDTVEAGLCPKQQWKS